MTLHFREYGQADKESVLLLHGLFGSSSNWHSMARGLEDRFHLLVPDLRNHGRSPHEEPMDYPAMAADVLHFMQSQGLERAHIVGHSMGGKLAMWLALHHPERVDKLCPVDMAPVSYSHGFSPLLDAMESIPLQSLQNRKEADEMLSMRLDNKSLRGFLLQNLVKEGDQWRWRLNLPVLRLHIKDIVSFPDIPDNTQFPGDTLFIHGGQSDYMKPEYAPIAMGFFPHARMRVIPQAGHWVYAEAPQEFLRILRGFL